MRTLTVDLAERSYPIYIGSGLLTQTQLFAPHIIGRKVAIVSNTTVAPLYLQQLREALLDYDVSEIILPDGESYKNWETLQLGKQFRAHPHQSTLRSQQHQTLLEPLGQDGNPVDDRKNNQPYCKP